MKRRKFVKTSAAAAALVGSLELLPSFTTDQKESVKKRTPSKDNRSPEYLKRVQKVPFLAKQPVGGKTYPIPPMPLADRISKKVVPVSGFCSIAPGTIVNEALISGNGTMNIEVMGHPYSEQILFHHENLMMPWKKPVEAPNVADIFPQVRQMMLDGKTRDAVTLALQRMNESPVKQDTEPHLTIPAFLMKLNMPEKKSARNYLRTVNFENCEIKVIWSDESGDWTRQTFTSRPDNVVVQKINAPIGKSLNLSIAVEKSAAWTMVSGMDWGARRGIGSTDPDMKAFANLTADQKKLAPKGVEAGDIKQDTNDQGLIYKCRLDPAVDNSGYAAITRVVLKGGTSRVNGNELIIENSSSVILLTRIEYFSELSDDKVESLKKSVEGINPDYQVLLDRHQKVHSEILSRVTLDFGGNQQYGMSNEELLSDQHSRPDYSAALMEKIFQMGRYWFIINSGKYPAIAAGINSTINLQIAGAVQGNLKEGMEAYFRWMEEIAPDCRKNAKNIFGTRGASYPLFPDKGIGASFYYTSTSDIGLWPYWISAGGFCLRHFWDHYLVTGDQDFLRKRVVPAYKEAALFYEDFLTLTDKDGYFIFVPSISPENTTRNSEPSGPTLINATMDVVVCREVLSNLIQACELLGTETAGVTKWKTMLAKLPNYLLEADGTLKEWSWPSLEEHYNHRHISHLYGIWPGDDIDPDRTSQLAHAAEIANRKRTFDVMSTAVAGETLAAYTRCHRALVGARLKDNILVDIQLRQLIEQGYISPSLRSSREPYAIPIPDAQAGLPAIMMEMLVYSRPGVIELLPALPPSILKGTIKGMLARTFARIDNLTWDMETRSVDVTITSARKQDITLISRHGIEEISAPDGVLAEALQKGGGNIDLHLPEGKPVKIQLKIGENKPLEWVDQTTI